MAESRGLSEGNFNSSFEFKKYQQALKSRFLQAFNAHRIEDDVYQLNKPYYETLSSLEAESPDFVEEVHEYLRYDVFDGIMAFKTSPPTPQHATVASTITAIVAQELYRIGLSSESNTITLALAKSMVFGGDGCLVSETAQLHPDAQFGLRGFEYPGVAAEVGWSQRWVGKAGLEAKLRELLLIGKGDTRAVMAVGIRPSKRLVSNQGAEGVSVSLSLWRLVPSNGSDIKKMIYDQALVAQNDDRVVALTLRDFAHPCFLEKNFAGADLDTAIEIPFKGIYEAALDGFGAYRRSLLREESKLTGNFTQKRFYSKQANLLPSLARTRPGGLRRFNTESPPAYRCPQLRGSVGGILSRLRRFPL